MARQNFIALLVSAGLLGGCGIGSVNGPVSIGPGQKAGDVSTVNGSIDVGDDAVITDVATVNGGITVGARVRAKSLATVNGAITLGDSARIDGDVATVNGSLSLANRAEVGGNLANVNGQIRLTAAHVGGDIATVNGDIEVGANAHVDGGIRVKRATLDIQLGNNVPRIIIGPGAVVRGSLKFERDVKLYVSDTASIGPIEGATPIKFSGDRPSA